MVEIFKYEYELIFVKNDMKDKKEEMYFFKVN